MKAQAIVKNHRDQVYVFAYGSLIWRPDFEHAEVWQGIVMGYERRFWQASHDHRGTAARPGRVVTMVPINGGQCEGLVYRLPENRRDDILATLDEREQDGYERTWLQATPMTGGESVAVLTWLAAAGNPSWVGDQPMDKLASLIYSRQGPSGSNLEYLLRLHESLDGLGIQDEHVKSLVQQVQTLSE